MADWSSLLGDLINRIVDRLLATDDLDYYMDLRAVCRGWRSSTAGPKNDSARFRPRQWVMLDEVHQSDARLFVNPATGRFVRKDLPVLRRYHLIAGAVGGSLVLAERSSPHAVCLLNPFTGSLTRFAAAVPSNISVVVAHVIGTGCSPPTLVLFCDHPDTIHWADPDSESFSSYEDESNGVRQALVGGIYAAARENGTVSSSLPPPEASKILTSLVTKQFAGYFSNAAEAAAAEQAENRCFLVESAGEILIVFKLPHRIEVFKIGDDMSVQPVQSIGRRALFVGKCRCLSVDADKFAAVDANSVYYVECISYSYDVRIYSLSEGTELCAGGAIGSLSYFSSNDSAPFSVVQLLSCYAYESAFSFSRIRKRFVFKWKKSLSIHTMRNMGTRLP
ncbi:uncharacterized protein [Miscanthus floridulus]|uniref:uncharacterized protein n=1 Tax=Miscanthus floridulus TaxID=154761 RepID=UPI00345B25F7